MYIFGLVYDPCIHVYVCPEATESSLLHAQALKGGKQDIDPITQLHNVRQLTQNLPKTQ